MSCFCNSCDESDKNGYVRNDKDPSACCFFAEYPSEKNAEFTTAMRSINCVLCIIGSLIISITMVTICSLILFNQLFAFGKKDQCLMTNIEMKACVVDNSCNSDSFQGRGSDTRTNSDGCIHGRQYSYSAVTDGCENMELQFNDQCRQSLSPIANITESITCYIDCNKMEFVTDVSQYDGLALAGLIIFSIVAVCLCMCSIQYYTNGIIYMLKPAKKPQSDNEDDSL
eukprot:359784_1